MSADYGPTVGGEIGAEAAVYGEVVDRGGSPEGG